MSELFLSNGKVIFPREGKVSQTDLYIKEGKIEEIGKSIKVKQPTPRIDLEGNYLSPGFIDLQVNGGRGIDFLNCEPEDVNRAGAFWLEHGTTSFLGTIITHPLDSMNDSIEILNRSDAKNLLGVHVEGPFLSREKRGTHNPAHLRVPKREYFEGIVGDCAESIKLFTFAPELEGAEELLSWIERIGGKPSIGHSNAKYEEALSFLDRGVCSFTHLFNGMRGFHHRRPGTAGAALNSNAYVGLICDGLHLHPGAVKLTERAKGVNEICLVTDAIAAAGMDDGDYLLGDQEITVTNGLAKIEDGTIAGSTLTMETAMKNFMDFTGVSLTKAIRTATLNPARLLGMEEEIGSMKRGSRADLVLFDEDLKIVLTIVNGEVVFEE